MPSWSCSLISGHASSLHHPEVPSGCRNMPGLPSSPFTSLWAPPPSCLCSAAPYSRKASLAVLYCHRPRDHSSSWLVHNMLALARCQWVLPICGHQWECFPGPATSLGAALSFLWTSQFQGVVTECSAGPREPRGLLSGPTRLSHLDWNGSGTVFSMALSKSQLVFTITFLCAIKG